MRPSNNLCKFHYHFIKARKAGKKGLPIKVKSSLSEKRCLYLVGSWLMDCRTKLVFINCRMAYSDILHQDPCQLSPFGRNGITKGKGIQKKRIRNCVSDIVMMLFCNEPQGLGIYKQHTGTELTHKKFIDESNNFSVQIHHRWT